MKCFFPCIAVILSFNMCCAMPPLVDLLHQAYALLDKGHDKIAFDCFETVIEKSKKFEQQHLLAEALFTAAKLLRKNHLIMSENISLEEKEYFESMHIPCDNQKALTYLEQAAEVSSVQGLLKVHILKCLAEMYSNQEESGDKYQPEKTKDYYLKILTMLDEKDPLYAEILYRLFKYHAAVKIDQEAILLYYKKAKEISVGTNKIVYAGLLLEYLRGYRESFKSYRLEYAAKEKNVQTLKVERYIKRLFLLEIPLSMQCEVQDLVQKISSS